MKKTYKESKVKPNIIERKTLLHIVNKFHTLFTDSIFENKVDKQLAITVVGAIFRWATCEGNHGLTRAKTMSNYYVRRVMGTPISDVPLSNKYRRLTDKALTLSTCTRSKIYWVSIFSAFRLFSAKPVVDVSSISGRFTGHITKLFRLNYWRAMLRVNKSFRMSVPDIKNWTCHFKWHISGASGPNGPLAYTQYLNDLRSLSSDRMLIIGLFILFWSLPYDNEGETVKALRNAYVDSLKLGEKQSMHSRLVAFGDKGDKTRVIALVDILSQSLLKTVHQRCNLVLRRLIQDGTFDQDRSRLYIKKKSLDSVQLASIDLKAATDRMPALFQAFVLISLRILNPLQALGWWWVSTRRDFVYNDGTSLKRVRYKVGQPMGSLSSWPVMAISHHYLVRFSFAVTGFYNLSHAPYALLGDDLTLEGHSVAEVYLRVISYLGMEYSVDKTYIANGVAEFAKSLFCQGEDLTPFPLALFKFNKNTIVSNTLAIITECKKRNLKLTSASLTGFFPMRWRNLVLLASLSPSSPRYGLDLQPRSDQWIFLQYLNIQRIMYFSRDSTVRDSTHEFVFADPGKSGMYISPYIQIAQDNGESYPVRYLGDEYRPLVMLGSNWVAYDTKAWPDGIPSLGCETLIPGPVWEKDKFREIIFRSSLLRFNRLLPDYFHTRCGGLQVGE